MYHFQLNGLEITCDTAEELKAAIIDEQPMPRRAATNEPQITHYEPASNGNGTVRKQGVAAFAAKCRRYAKKHNVTYAEARTALAAPK
jgi:hypothetical protein